MNLKGLILSGGHGNRLRPLTHSQQKQLIPVANKPVLFYAIEDVIEAGVKDIGIITGPNREQVIETVKSGDWGSDINFEFIHQGEPKGLAHTIKVADEHNFLGSQSFVMYLGDNILKEGIKRHANKFRENDHDASIMLTEVDNPQQFGVADLKGDGKVKKLVEKPEEPPSNLALVGIYFFKPIITEAVENIEYSWRDELEITDAIQWLIDNGYEVGCTRVKNWWKDTGRPEDILHANRLVLDEIKGDAKTLKQTRGRVRIPKSAEIDDDSTIKGPTIIGENCVIEESFIGPYTSIGKNCKLKNTEIEDSVILKGTQISNGGRIIDSLIGENVEIVGADGQPSGKSLTLGDNSKINL